ncbi:MAG: single-stranded DNA-binding protein [Verrucomicrobia bacterium]|nr:single-stranded DNA-binding protein [Verrucomicrobiota bacterium]MBU1734076.1 single-stranded DNA-binding protein [Verrucomicrobiota bacterium]MBU1856185.1 single-stranded DNA-binding protein [Verrucomicrobiota bacterium]
MANLNRVFLIGNLTRDPEIRYIPSGKAVADLNMAINRKYRTTSGEFKEETCYVGVVVWERQAETAGEYLKKGSAILVEGSLRYEQWETNGEKKSRLRVNADRIQFLDRLKRPVEPSEASEAGQRQNAPAAASEPAAPAVTAPGEEKGDDDNLPF